MFATFALKKALRLTFLSQLGGFSEMFATFTHNKAFRLTFLSHFLNGVCYQISPSFKKNFAVMLKKRTMKHPFERVPTPYQVYSWLAPQPDHPVDYIRAEDGQCWLLVAL